MEYIPNSDWRILPEFPKYAITPDGQIWSFKRNKFLKQFQDRHGYLRVNLSNDLGVTTRNVHRLTGMAFIPLPKEFNGNYDMATINHIDLNRTNNHYTNLEWVGLSYNSREVLSNGYMSRMKKPCFLIDSLNDTYKTFDSYSDIDRYLNLPANTAANAINRTNGLIRGRYIARATDGLKWKGILSNRTIKNIIKSYADQIKLYKQQRGPKKIINLKTNESKVYNSLSDFAREHGLNPSNASNYLKNHSDLYRVELA